MGVTYRNPGLVEFDGTIQETGGGGAFIEFPYAVEDLFGVKGRVPVTATFNGIPYRGSMVKMGSTCHLLLILKNIRHQLKKDTGDMVHVIVELDDQPRVVELPDDVRQALTQHPAAHAKYNQLAFTHQREYIMWIESAKRATTRTSRIQKMMGLLGGGALTT